MDHLPLAGHLVDLVIGCIVLEALALTFRRPGAVRSALPSLGAGLAMALALRFALTDAVWPWVWVCLAAAGVAHGFEVMRRWRAG